MHEVSLVAALIEACERQAAGHRVSSVRVRHATTIPLGVLEQAFALLTESGLLADAELRAEPFDLAYRCACGSHGPVGHDDLMGGAMAACPSCGAPVSIPRTAELELVELVMERGDPR